MSRYISNFQDFEGWLKDNGLNYWKISSSTSPQNNDNKFVFDKTKEYEENLRLCQTALDRFAGQMLYATGWRTSEARTGGFSCVVLYSDAGSQQKQETPVQVQGLAGAFDKETLIEEITQKVRNEYETLNLKRERETLDADRKAFNEQKEGVLGLLVHYLAPVAKQVMGVSTRVAGMDAQNVEATAIRVKKETPQAEVQETEESPFSDEEAEKLMELMTRFASVEPQYLELLERVVEMAERGDKMYMSAKTMLL